MSNVKLNPKFKWQKRFGILDFDIDLAFGFYHLDLFF